MPRIWRLDGKRWSNILVDEPSPPDEILDLAALIARVTHEAEENSIEIRVGSTLLCNSTCGYRVVDEVKTV